MTRDFICVQVIQMQVSQPDLTIALKQTEEKRESKPTNNNFVKNPVTIEPRFRKR